MTDDEFWGVIPPAITTDAEPEPEPEPARDPEGCSACGRLPLHRDRAAAGMLLSRIRAAHRDRLERTEWALARLPELERVGVARWLQSALDRPPLANARHTTWDPLRTVLDALWRDIYWLTPDPASPSVEYDGESWTVPEPHHDLAAMRNGRHVPV